MSGAPGARVWARPAVGPTRQGAGPSPAERAAAPPTREGAVGGAGGARGMAGRGARGGGGDGQPGAAGGRAQGSAGRSGGWFDTGVPPRVVSDGSTGDAIAPEEDRQGHARLDPLSEVGSAAPQGRDDRRGDGPLTRIVEGIRDGSEGDQRGARVARHRPTAAVYPPPPVGIVDGWESRRIRRVPAAWSRATSCDSSSRNVVEPVPLSTSDAPTHTVAIVGCSATASGSCTSRAFCTVLSPLARSTCTADVLSACVKTSCVQSSGRSLLRVGVERLAAAEGHVDLARRRGRGGRSLVGELRRGCTPSPWLRRPGPRPGPPTPPQHAALAPVAQPPLTASRAGSRAARRAGNVPATRARAVAPTMPPTTSGTGRPSRTPSRPCWLR